MARAARNSKKKSSNPRVNFEGVETISVVPEGEYITRVGAVKMDESQAGNDYLAWELIITGGKNKGKKLFHNTSLAEQSLWATKKFLENLGVEVEDGEMELELSEYVDMEIGVVVEHETYKGRARSRVVDTFPAEDEGSEKGDDEGGGEGTTYTEDQINEMGKKELAALNEEHELEVELEGSTASQRRAMIKALKKADLIGDGDEDEKPKGKKSKVAEEEDDEKPAKGRKPKKSDEDEEDEKPARKSRRGKKDEEEDEDEKPKSRRGRKAKDEDEEDEPKSKKSKKSKTYSADEINSMDEEALGEVIETHELDVDLDDHSTMKRKRSAVIDALEGAELLEE